MAKKKAAKSEEKKEITNEEVLKAVEEMGQRLSKRMQELEGRADAAENRLEIHGKMFREQAEPEPEIKGMTKEDYPQKCHEMVENPKSTVKWVRVTPRMTYASPGITIDHVTVPFHKDVSMWTLTTFQEEAEKRGIL